MFQSLYKICHNHTEWRTITFYYVINVYVVVQTCVRVLPTPSPAPPPLSLSLSHSLSLSLSLSPSLHHWGSEYKLDYMTLILYMSYRSWRGEMERILGRFWYDSKTHQERADNAAGTHSGSGEHDTTLWQVSQYHELCFGRFCFNITRKLRINVSLIVTGNS